MKYIATVLPFFLIAGLSVPALAQMERVIHQTFEVGKASEIHLDLYGKYSIEPWAGNNILTETKIQVYDAPAHVLDFFVNEKGRYEILDALNEEAGILQLSSRDKRRAGIQYKETTCYEFVELRVFIPDSFSAQSETVLVRQAEKSEN